MAHATAYLNLNDPARPNGSYVVSSLTCMNTNNETLTVGGEFAPTVSLRRLSSLSCTLPPAPVPAGSTDVVAPALTCVILKPAAWTWR